MPPGQASLFAPATTPSPAALRAAHAQLLRDHSLQFSFANAAPPLPPAVPEWLKWLAQFLHNATHVLGWVFWGGVALGAAVLLVFIGRELLRTRWPNLFKAKASPRPSPLDWRPEPARARALLEEADRLAAAGDYAEAAHLLLYRSIEDIEGRRPRLIRPALTARDIVGLDELPGAARQAFQVIAEVVETSFFGGRAVDAGAFETCRRAYEAFAFAGAWA